MKNDLEYYKVSEVAKILRCTVQHVYNYLKDDQNPLPHYVIGRTKLIKVSEFEEWIQKGKIK